MNSSPKMIGSIGREVGSSGTGDGRTQLSGLSDTGWHPSASWMEHCNPMEVSVVMASWRRLRSETGEPIGVCVRGDVVARIVEYTGGLSGTENGVLFESLVVETSSFLNQERAPCLMAEWEFPYTQTSAGGRAGSECR